MITEYIVGTSKREQRGVNNVPKSRYWGGKAPDWVDEDASGAPGLDPIRSMLWTQRDIVPDEELVKKEPHTNHSRSCPHYVSLRMSDFAHLAP